MNSLLSTKAIFFRNIKDYKFSHKLSAEHKQEIVNKLAVVLGEDFTLLTLNNLDAKVINYLNLYRPFRVRILVRLSHFLLKVLCN